MHFETDHRLKGFRHEVRAFLHESLPPDLARRGARGYMSSRADTLRWQRILYDKGWGAPQWPAADGGTGWSAMQQVVFEEECAFAGAPVRNIQAISTLGPIINAFGTPEQKSRFIPPILRGEVFWCQGFSEPEAGSDLASLKTRADRDGDTYVVNGQKIWTSLAHWADWVFLLVRTGTAARKQAGLSLLLVDMKTPGITIRPIISIDGCHHLNQTFYDGVAVPVANRIGPEDGAWDVTKHLLGNERVFGSADLPMLKRYLFLIKRTAQLCVNVRGTTLVDDELFMARLAELEMEVLAIEMFIFRLIGTGEKSSGRGWVNGSVLKIRAAEVHQKLGELLLETLGDHAAVFRPDPEGEYVPETEPPGPAYGAGWAADFFYRRAKSIAGGTSEIQRNIIAKELLSG